MATPSAPAKGMSKKQKITLGVVAGAGTLVGVLYLRSRSSSSSSSANSQANEQTQQEAALEAEGIDPETGVPYSEEYSGLTAGLEGTYNPLTGEYEPGIGDLLGYGTTTSTATTTNAEWAQNALTTLEGLGYSSQTAGQAIGDYLAGNPLSSSEYEIVTTALGLTGQPPTSVPAITQSPSTGQATTTSSGVSALTNYANEVQSGAGFWPGNTAAEYSQLIQGIDGNLYSYISTPQLASQISTQYVQSEPGVFTQITPGSNLPANTPIYQRVSAA
jgi:hypothetical protein